MGNLIFSYKNVINLNIKNSLPLDFDFQRCCFFFTLRKGVTEGCLCRHVYFDMNELDKIWKTNY